MTIDLARFFTLRQRLFDLIRYVNEGYHKSYEGALDLTFSFTNVFNSNDNPEPPESVRIDLACYLLPLEGRHEAFYGATLNDALNVFESWLVCMERHWRNEKGDY